MTIWRTKKSRFVLSSFPSPRHRHRADHRQITAPRMHLESANPIPLRPPNIGFLLIVQDDRMIHIYIHCGANDKVAGRVQCRGGWQTGVRRQGTTVTTHNTRNRRQAKKKRKKALHARSAGGTEDWGPKNARVPIHTIIWMCVCERIACSWVAMALWNWLLAEFECGSPSVSPYTQFYNSCMGSALSS